MRKQIFIANLVFLLLLQISYAYIDCTPSSCPAGFTNNGIICSGGTCYRNCTGLACTDNTWTEVYNESQSFESGQEDESLTYSSYTSNNASMCYKFTYKAADQDIKYTVNNWNLDPPNGEDCDVGSIAGFWEQGKPSSPWYKDLTEQGTWGYNQNRSWGDVTDSNFDYFFIAARAHTDNDTVHDPSFDPQMEKDYSIYCAPSSTACNYIGNYNLNCDTTCYNRLTYLYVYSASIADTNAGNKNNWTQYNNDLRMLHNCWQNNTIENNFLYPRYIVSSMPALMTIDTSISCERSNEAPNASNVKVLPLNATLGDDLVCNYSYLDPESFEEKDSSYKWYKNGVNQNINSQTLAKGNLTLNDKWYCYITPSDGLLNGTERVSSNNVTILSTVSNPKMYVENQLVWNKTGSWSGEEFIHGFEDELNNALDNCTQDAEGYCNITLSFSSDTNGTLNLSNMEIYYVIPTSQSNITINNLSVIYSNNLNKIFEFIIQNPTSSAQNASWSLHMGDGVIINSTYNATLQANEKLIVYVEYNYTNKGFYTINATARANNLTASANISVYIGDIIITELSEVYSSKLNRLFAFTILNNENSNLTNVNWSLNTGEQVIYANLPVNLSAGERLLVFVEYNYTNYGTYNLIAAANASSKSHSKTITISVLPPLNIYNFSQIYNNALNNLFGFRVNNDASWQINFTNVNWSFNTGESTIYANTLTSISSNESVLYYIEYNYTAPGEYVVNVTAFNGTYANSANITVEISPINIYDLSNIYSNSLNRLFGFKVNNRNSWNINITNLNWTFDTGESNISAKLLTQIAKNETILYYIEYNYTNAGTYNLNVTATNGTYFDSEQIQMAVN